MASAVRDSAELRRVSGVLVEMDEEDDLFEINLEAVNSIPPAYYWDSYFTATENALLANCLLPISHVSNAVPMAATGECKLFPFAGRGASVFVFAEPTRLEKLLRLPHPGTPGFQAWINQSQMMKVNPRDDFGF